MSLGQPHRHFAECGSTSDLARAWALENQDWAPHGALVTADYQTRGRGRRGREWEATSGDSALMSVVLRPSFPQADAWQIAFLASLAAADTLSALGLAPALKWPNDVLIESRKTAGVLIETVSSSAHGWAAIVGIGINVNQVSFPHEDTFLMPPISLRLATGSVQSVPQIIESILTQLDAHLAQYETQGWPHLLDSWRRRMARDIVLRRGTVPAILRDVNLDGSATVEMPDGTLARWMTVEAEEGAIGPPNRV